MKTLTKNFVNTNYIKKYKLLITSLIKSCILNLIDNKLILNITYIKRFQLTLSDFIDKLQCLIISLNKCDIILKIS